MGTSSPAISIAILADAGQATRAFDDVGTHATTASRDMGKAGDASREFGSSVEGAGDASSKAAGGLGDLGGALSEIPGPLGTVGTGMETLAPLVMGVTGAADLAALAGNALKASFLGQAAASARAAAASAASRVATIAGTVAVGAATAAQWLWNIALSANPIGAIILLIVALVAGFVILWTKSETFRSIVLGALHAVGAGFMWLWETWKKAVGFIFDALGDLIGWFVGLNLRVAKAFNGLWDGLTQGFRDAVNFIIDAWNSIDFGIHISIAGHGVDIDDIFPDIPRLAKGGIVTGPTIALVGESGPELIQPLRGNELGGSNTTVNVTAYITSNDPDDIFEKLQQKIRRDGLGISR